MPRAVPRMAGLLLVLVVIGGCAIGTVTTAAGPDGPRQTAYTPKRGKGPIVLVLSGATGPSQYHGFAVRLAEAGYYIVLLDGNDLFTRDERGKVSLQMAIARAQRAPNGIPGKVAVIGFSLGGGVALVSATAMADEVSAVIAYYPSTSFVTDPRRFVERFRVPTLVLAGEQDRYRNCCLVETIRAIDAAATERQAEFTLVVYPGAEHGFNLPVPAYRADFAEDAWQRTLEMLGRSHAVR